MVGGLYYTEVICSGVGITPIAAMFIESFKRPGSSTLEGQNIHLHDLDMFVNLEAK